MRNPPPQSRKFFSARRTCATERSARACGVVGLAGRVRIDGRMVNVAVTFFCLWPDNFDLSFGGVTFFIRFGGGVRYDLASVDLLSLIKIYFQFGHFMFIILSLSLYVCLCVYVSVPKNGSR